MASRRWERGDAEAQISRLYEAPIGDHDVAVIYFGWAGILLRTIDAVMAMDLCDANFHLSEVSLLAQLDVHTYSHSHWDHWHAPTARAISEQTGAPMILEPQILEAGEIDETEATAAHPGEAIRIGEITLAPIAGIHPRPITLFHIRTPSLNVFHGADSGHVPLADYRADLAIVPVGTPSPSCSPQDAVAMIEDLGATAAIAVHGSEKDLAGFRRLAARRIPDVRICTPHAGELATLSV